MSNASDAIKIACDFLSVESLEATEHLVREFRQQRLATGSGDDVLQLYKTLWYAWTWLSEQEISPPVQPNTNDSAGGARCYIQDDNIASDTFAPADPSVNPETSRPMDNLWPSPASHEACHSFSKTQRQTERNRRKRRLQVYAKREVKPQAGQEVVRCPLCVGTFNRNGLINHL